MVWADVTNKELSSVTIFSTKGRLPQKKRENVGIFPKSGTPSPVWECYVCEKKKWFILHFRTLGTFIFVGSPMLKTVKNGSGIRVDPPPPFFF